MTWNRAKIWILHSSPHTSSSSPLRFIFLKYEDMKQRFLSVAVDNLQENND